MYIVGYEVMKINIEHHLLYNNQNYLLFCAKTAKIRHSLLSKCAKKSAI